MKKPRKFLLLFGLCIVIAAGLFLSKPLCGRVSAWCGPLPSQVASSQLQTLAPGYYVYSDASLQYAQSHDKVLLYFWAPWCTTCTSLDQDLQSQKVKVPAGISILRVNYDQATALKQRYHVVTQHTFVQIDASGMLLTSWVGGDISKLQQELR